MYESACATPTLHHDSGRSPSATNYADICGLFLSRGWKLIVESKTWPHKNWFEIFKF
jgi:hypothetical protein